jgi:hypothetical protein
MEAHVLVLALGLGGSRVCVASSASLARRKRPTSSAMSATAAAGSLLIASTN